MGGLAFTSMWKGNQPRGGRMSAEQAASATTPATPAAATAPSTPTPVGGIGLGMSALWAVIRGFFSRLFGGEKKA